LQLAIRHSGYKYDIMILRRETDLLPCIINYENRSKILDCIRPLFGSSLRKNESEQDSINIRKNAYNILHELKEYYIIY